MVGEDLLSEVRELRARLKELKSEQNLLVMKSGGLEKQVEELKVVREERDMVQLEYNDVMKELREQRKKNSMRKRSQVIFNEQGTQTDPRI